MKLNSNIVLKETACPYYKHMGKFKKDETGYNVLLNEVIIGSLKTKTINKNIIKIKNITIIPEFRKKGYSNEILVSLFDEAKTIIGDALAEHIQSYWLHQGAIFDSPYDFVITKNNFKNKGGLHAFETCYE